MFLYETHISTKEEKESKDAWLSYSDKNRGWKEDDLAEDEEGAKKPSTIEIKVIER